MKARDLGLLLLVSVARPSSSSPKLISEMGAAYGNVLRAAMGTDPIDRRPAASPAWTGAGVRERLYETYRDRWISTGDLDALDQMVRQVR